MKNPGRKFIALMTILGLSFLGLIAGKLTGDNFTDISIYSGGAYFTLNVAKAYVDKRAPK